MSARRRDHVFACPHRCEGAVLPSVQKNERKDTRGILHTGVYFPLKLELLPPNRFWYWMLSRSSPTPSIMRCGIFCLASTRTQHPMALADEPLPRLPSTPRMIRCASSGHAPAYM